MVNRLLHLSFLSKNRVRFPISIMVNVDFRPAKAPRLDKETVLESKPISAYGRLKIWEPEKDEYVRQYLQFHYQFHKTQGFGIEWEKYDYFFDKCHPYDGAPPISATNRTNEELIVEVTLQAIDKYNKDNGVKLVFAELVEANFMLTGYFENWVTFWAIDVSSPCPESKLYQAEILSRAGSFLVPIFRVKPTEEEMMAAFVHVDPPLPMHHDIYR